MALGEDIIDASSFTVVRLLSGTVMLRVILTLSAAKDSPYTRGSWLSALMLFLYAITFSFAYISLDIGTGALVLFGAVQITMILSNIISGNKLHISEWLGVFIAFMGFVYLILPMLTTPSFLGFVLMTAAGIAWGIYTLRGRTSMHPLADTAYNFVRTTPFVIVLVLIAVPTIQLSWEGIIFAAMSGAVASGIGYTVWYIALSGLSATEAAVVQLSVPVIAAIGGIVLLSEAITVRLVFAAVMILGGILIVVLGRYYFVQLRAEAKT
jgi:drug/metabolite transporter (DMT)-like permease